jgi:hypothetical protein
VPGLAQSYLAATQVMKRAVKPRASTCRVPEVSLPTPPLAKMRFATASTAVRSPRGAVRDPAVDLGDEEIGGVAVHVAGVGCSAHLAVVRRGPVAQVDADGDVAQLVAELLEQPAQPDRVGAKVGRHRRLLRVLAGELRPGEMRRDVILGIEGASAPHDSRALAPSTAFR